MRSPSDSDEFTIKRLPEGGFIVTGPTFHQGMCIPFLFASTTLTEALAFVKQKFTPPRTSK